MEYIKDFEAVNASSLILMVNDNMITLIIKFAILKLIFDFIRALIKSRNESKFIKEASSVIRELLVDEENEDEENEEDECSCCDSSFEEENEEELEENEPVDDEDDVVEVDDCVTSCDTRYTSVRHQNDDELANEAIEASSNPRDDEDEESSIVSEHDDE